MRKKLMKDPRKRREGSCTGERGKGASLLVKDEEKLRVGIALRGEGGNREMGRV